MLFRSEAYNDDMSVVKTRSISVIGAEQESKLIVQVSSKEIALGETVSYDLIIVNSGSNIATFEIAPETTDAASVSVDRSVVTVQAGSSTVVKVSAKANKEGTISFAVNVRSAGNVVKNVVLSANVKEKMFANSTLVLTIVLAVIFVVLLIVLIVLLTRKSNKSELEESYY